MCCLAVKNIETHAENSSLIIGETLLEGRSHLAGGEEPHNDEEEDSLMPTLEEVTGAATHLS